MKKILGFFCSLCLMYSQLLACTGISIHTQDDKHIQARTIEWGEFDLKSEVILSPKNQEFTSLTPTGKDGIKWKAKYGFVGISVTNPEFIGEGINEAGLNAGLFYFAHYGKLAPYNPKEKKNAISDMELTKYILSNFASVEEVKQALKTLKVVPFMLFDGKAPPTAHWRVNDAKGGRIVIEIVDGIVNIYDNPIGVLTNSPDFPWQLKNLNNYVNVFSGSAPNSTMGGLNIFPFGAGSGYLGIPGDFTPPSRFVRAAFFLHASAKPKDAYEGITQAFHLLNLFDLPIGTEFKNKEEIKLPSATQWTAVSNQSDLEFYYKTMYNSQIRKIDLKQIDFSKIKYQKHPLDTEKKESFQELHFN